MDARRIALHLVAVAVIAGAASLGAFVAGGGRLLHVRTASMGTAAPVGSLVVTTPASPDDLRVGDVVAVRAAAGAPVVTHRVVSLAGGVRTRGDLNGAPDPWTVDRTSLVGRAVAVYPAAGAALRATPPCALGWALVALAARRCRPHARRQAVLVAGVPVVVAVVIALQRPLVGVVSTATYLDPSTTRVTANIVSTGVLPSRVSTPGGDSALLSGGEHHRFTAGPGASANRLDVSASPELRGLWLVAAILVIASPTCWALWASRRRPLDDDTWLDGRTA